MTTISISNAIRPPVLALVALTLATFAAPSGAQEIRGIAGNLYRVDDGPNTSVFMVTTQGIILVDPQSTQLATWLKDELAQRFPDQPVRYVVFTQHHFRRAGGGSVFGATAELVAHERFTEERLKSARALPPEYASLDANRSRELEREEHEGTPSAAAVASFDHNRDGIVVAADFYNAVTSPEAVFRSQRTITLGDERVELLHAPTAGAPENTIVYFSGARLLFGVDVPSAASLPQSFGAQGVAGTLKMLRTIDALEFDSVLTGSGDTGAKADVTTLRQYLDDLVGGVRQAFDAGRSIDEASKTVTLDKYASLSDYSTRRAANVAEVYRTLRVVSLDSYAGGHLTSFSSGVECYWDCADDVRQASGLMGGVSVSIGRMVISSEWAGQRHPFTFRSPPMRAFGDISYGWVRQRLDRTNMFLFGYDVYRTPRVLIGFDAGVSFGAVAVATTELVPFRQQTFRQDRTTTNGLTGGARIVVPITRRLSAFVPVRITQSGSPKAWLLTELGRSNVSVGAALRMNLVRRSL